MPSIRDRITNSKISSKLHWPIVDIDGDPARAASSCTQFGCARNTAPLLHAISASASCQLEVDEIVAATICSKARSRMPSRSAALSLKWG